MTQLAANVNADAERWTLDSLPSTQYVQVDDETIEVRAMFPSSTYSLTGETLPPRIRVRRGIAGTTKASHLSGATLTPNYGLGSSEGAGGVTVDDGTTTAEVDTLNLPGADLSVPGTATHWQTVVEGALNADLHLGPAGTSLGTGDVFVGPTAVADGDGAADASVSVTSNGIGDAQALVTVDAVGTGAALSGMRATRGATQSGFLIEVSAADLPSIIALGLPAANPNVAGQLWNDAGTLKVSAG